MKNTNSSIGRSRVSSLGELGRQPSRPSVLKNCDNRRVVNPNFLFFCQVVILIVPIAVLYAGLYFLDVSPRVIVLVCGVAIFAFLVVVICVRPFTTPEPKGEDTVPLTQDMSPSGDHSRYSSGIKHQIPSRSQESVKSCSLSLPRREAVQGAVVEACSCPDNPTPQEMDQSDGEEQSDHSNSSLQSDKDSSAHSVVSNASEEAPKDDSLPPPVCAIRIESKQTDSNSGKASKSSIDNGKRSGLEDSQNSDDKGEKQNEIRFEQSELNADDLPQQEICPQTPKSSGPEATDHGAPRPVKQRSVLRVGPCSTPSRVKRVLFSDSDDEPLAKQTRDDEEKTPCQLHPTNTLLPTGTPELGLLAHAAGDGLPQSEMPSTLRCPVHCDKNQLPAVTIRLFPKSSREGIFEWVPSNPSCRLGGGFNAVVYSMQPIEAAEGSASEITGNESSQNMLPLNTDTLHQRMVSSLEERVKLFQDFGAQVEIPENITPKPSSVVYVINEKVPSRASSSSKTQKSEPIQCEPMQPSKDSAYATQRGNVSVCNDSILDFVMRRPVSAKSETVANFEENGSFKTSAAPALESKVNVDMMDDEKPKDIGLINTVRISSTTPVSGSSGSTPCRWSSCDSRGLLKCDLPYLEPKDETWKIKGNDRAKMCSPKEEYRKDNISAEQSMEFFTSLYMGCKDKMYQPGKLGLLVTESSKEEMIPGMRKAGHSPKTKKKSKIRPGEYHTDSGLLDGKVAVSKNTSRLGKRDREERPPVSTPKKHVCMSSSSYKRSPDRNPPSPTRCQQSQGWYNESPTEFHLSSTTKPEYTRRKPHSPHRNEKSPIINPQSPTRHQPPSRYNKCPIRGHQSPTRNHLLTGRKQSSPLMNKKSPCCHEQSHVRNPQSPTRCPQSTSLTGKSPTKYHQSPTRKPVSTTRKRHSPHVKQDVPRSSSSTSRIQHDGQNEYNKRQTRGELTDTKGRRFSFPPFNLDFSTGFHDDDGNNASSERWQNGQQAPLDRKRRPAKDKKRIQDEKSLLTSPGKCDKSLLMSPEKCKSPEGSPTRNKNRRISHRVESTLFKKSSSSYDNVIIERVLKQKKKTLKKFK